VPVKGVLARAISAAATVSHAVLGVRPDDVAAGTTAADTFWRTLATGNRAGLATRRFAGAERQLLTTLPLANQTLGAATAATGALEPLAREIAAEDPDFVGLFASGPQLLDAARRFNHYAPRVLRELMPALGALHEPALALPLIVSYGSLFDRALAGYSTELNVAARQLAAVTSYTYNGHTALRVTGTLGCAGGRDPYPAPGQAFKDRRAC
jgi:hypothetical protein